MQTNYIVMMKPKACKVWTPAYERYHPAIEKAAVLCDNFFESLSYAKSVCKKLNGAKIPVYMAGLGRDSRLEFKVGTLTVE